MTENAHNKVLNLHKKSHETLMRLLNNIGIVGAILAGIVDLIVVIIFVFGVDIKQDFTSNIIYASINAFVGVLINVHLRYQGQKYAEIENQSCHRSLL